MTAIYLLDENLPPWWAKAICRLEPELTVWCVGQPGAPPRGSADPIVLEWCASNRAYLLTNNRRSMPGHLSDFVATGRHVVGIFVIDVKQSIVELAEELNLIAGASFVHEYRDQIVHLPII